MDHKQRQRQRERKRKEADRRKRARAANPPAPVGAKAIRVVNKRFNREETALDHNYFHNFQWAEQEDHVTDGWLKCRLLHGRGVSLIVPDQVFVEQGGLKWIQPLGFMANLVTKFSDHEIVCNLPVDISCGHTLRIQFFNHGLVRDLPDGSQLYKCKITGPADLHEYSTGEAEWNAGGVPYLHLYHHTTSDTCPKIVASGNFRTGSYNIQGTTKQLKNVAYSYFTPLNAIKNDNDLKKIAMAAGGTLELRRDGFDLPPVLFPKWKETYKNEILILPVYPCKPEKREASLDMWIDSSVLAPQHIYRHDEGGPVYYEIPHHFIHRVGTEPGNTVSFDTGRRIHRQPGLKSFDYIVVGDCTTLAGLAAPYDEEDTTHIMKVERMPAGKSMLNFWFEQGNQDLYTGKKVEMQEFHPPAGGAGGAVTP